MEKPLDAWSWTIPLCPRHGLCSPYQESGRDGEYCGCVSSRWNEETESWDTLRDGYGFVATCSKPVERVAVVPRSELERVEAERDLALKALGYDSYEIARQYLVSALSGPAPAGWPYAVDALSADLERGLNPAATP
jgi:hypothetical protein